MSTRAGDPAAERGTVLLDAMVAAAIVAGAAGLLVTVALDGLDRARAAESRRMALLVAESRLAAVGAEPPLTVGRSSGRDGAFVWTVEVAPYRRTGGASAAGTLMQVEVTAGRLGESAPRAVLRSVRLVPAD